MALTLREYTAAFFLAGFAITGMLNFGFSLPGSIDGQYGMNVDSGKLDEVRNDISSQRANRSQLSNTARGVSVEQTSGFISGLKSALNIVTNSLSTLTAIPSIANDIVASLGLPAFISDLVYLPIVGVAYAVVKVLTGVDG